MLDYLEQIQVHFGKTEYIKIIKTGKEAEVHLLRVNSEYMALKIYKEHIKYSSRGEYLDIKEIGDKRLRRAAKKKTRVGLSVIKDTWVNREFDILKKLYEYGAIVPKPYMKFENGILMEYLGSGESAAPRLSDITIPHEDIEETYNIIMDHIYIFKELGFAHGDLSEFNIIWFKNLPYIIDFPQIVFEEKSEFKEKLNKDIENINKYFKRYQI